MNVKRYHARLRLLPCAVCIALEELPPKRCEELHHVGDPQTERDDWLVVPLCHRHHEGEDGIHHLRRRGFFKKTALSDITLLAVTNRLYHMEMP